MITDTRNPPRLDRQTATKLPQRYRMKMGTVDKAEVYRPDIEEDECENSSEGSESGGVYRGSRTYRGGDSDEVEDQRQADSSLSGSTCCESDIEGNATSSEDENDEYDSDKVDGIEPRLIQSNNMVLDLRVLPRTRDKADPYVNYGSDSIVREESVLGDYPGSEPNDSKDSKGRFGTDYDDEYGLEECKDHVTVLDTDSNCSGMESYDVPEHRHWIDRMQNRGNAGRLEECVLDVGGDVCDREEDIIEWSSSEYEEQSPSPMQSQLQHHFDRRDMAQIEQFQHYYCPEPEESFKSLHLEPAVKENTREWWEVRLNQRQQILEDQCKKYKQELGQLALKWERHVERLQKDLTSLNGLNRRVSRLMLDGSLE